VIKFLELTPRRRAELVEYVRTEYQDDVDPALPSPSQVWLGRMQAALCEPVPQAIFNQILTPYEDYLETLPEEERDELQRRVGLFIHYRDQILSVPGVIA
jgi:hypothetical protein